MKDGIGILSALLIEYFYHRKPMTPKANRIKDHSYPIPERPKLDTSQLPNICPSFAAAEGRKSNGLADIIL